MDNNHLVIINNACVSLKKLAELLNDDADHYEERGSQLAATVSHARARFATDILNVLDSINSYSNRKAG